MTADNGMCPDEPLTLTEYQNRIVKQQKPEIFCRYDMDELAEILRMAAWVSYQLEIPLQDIAELSILKSMSKRK